ncbi:MAG: glycosyltransferase family 4 protein [Bacteroidales bacterium]|nr:glycosyltransferase family 4 protein [Bacteroidales bacterium]
MTAIKKILFLSPYPVDKAPSQRLKYEQYFSVFEKAGYEVHSNSFFSEKLWSILYDNGHFFAKFILTAIAYLKRFGTLFLLRKYDLVYIHLWVTPIGMPIFEWLVSKISKQLVYDIDDMVFLGHASKANAYIKSLKGRRKMIYLMKVSKHVITCTPKLDEFVRQYNQNTTDISSTVDTENRYHSKENYHKHTPIVIGWSGSHSTSKYLYLLKNVFVKLAKKYSIQLMVMGDADFYIDGVDVTAVEWKEAIEIATLEKFDIGVYPLPDEPWVYGKSGLKAIQYMALGIPTIASAIGTNFRIIEDGLNGFLATNEDEWFEKLSLLIENAELRKKLGQAGRNTVVEKYSVEANKGKYLSVFNEILE